MALAGLAAACGGGNGGGNHGPPPTYTITATVSGLASSGLVLELNNGNNLSVSENGSVTFPTTLAAAASYAVTVSTQPAEPAQTCLVSNGAGTVGAANVGGISVTCVFATWSWVGGSNVTGARGVYGTQGVPAVGNIPGARSNANATTDPIGNHYLFGGIGFDGNGDIGSLNDLWKYDPLTSQWTWLSGAASAGNRGSYGTLGVASSINAPGARNAASSWSDALGNLWVFGGFGGDSLGIFGALNDLWEFNIFTGQWTWMSGSTTANAPGVYGSPGVPSPSVVPGARVGASAWGDALEPYNGWVFGGGSSDVPGVYFNDLWVYNPEASQWTWVTGSSSTNAAGIYGTKGTPSATNVPGARNNASAWSDQYGNLWLFGGFGCDSNGAQGALNDLWEFDVRIRQWIWMSGSNVVGATGDYGLQGIASATNMPGARYSASAANDSLGNFFLFGGITLNAAGFAGANDLWFYSPLSGQWTWVSGSSIGDSLGSYGAIASVTADNAPGARSAAAAWPAPNQGELLIFGGLITQSANVTSEDSINDLWLLQEDSPL
jgi:N-acetylneuraminic acid mutarotase